MNRLILCGLFLTVSALFAADARGAVPQLIDYQGYLMESGAAVTGSKSITFSLYDAASGGTQLCTSGAQTITITKGVFTYQIGSSGCTLSSINWDNPVYLELNVQGTTLAPREQVAGAAYSVQTKAMNVVFAPAGNIAATDVQSAIAELDAEKLSLSGGTVTGTITATAFAGDGSALTGINASALDHGTMGGLADDDHTQYFNLSQAETATGALTMSGANGDITFDNAGGMLTLAGGNILDSAGPVNVADTLYVSGNVGVGTPAPSEKLYINGGNLLVGDLAGPSLLITDLNDAQYNLTTDATLNSFKISHYINGDFFTILSTGNVGIGTITPTNMFEVQNTGTAGAGYFNTNNAANSAAVVDARTSGTGNLYYGNHTGAGGNLIEMQSAGSNMFVVDKSGNVYASGTLTVAGSGGSYVLKSGDAMTGSLGVTVNSGGNAVGGTQSGAGNGIYGYTTGTGRAGYFVTNNGTTGANTVQAESNSANNSSFAAFQSGAGGELFFGNHTGASGNLIQLQSGGSDMFAISKTGKAGIGTSVPGGNIDLYVVEPTDAAGVIALDSGNTTAQYSALDFYDRGTNVWGVGKDNLNSFYIQEISSGNKHLYIKPGGAVGIGTITPGAVGAAKLEIYGANASAVSGPHIQYLTDADSYPVFQQLNYGHDNVALNFDVYYDGANWRSSDAGSNFSLYKNNDKMKLAYKSGVAAGSTISFDSGIVLLASNGNVGIGTDTPANKLEVQNTGAAETAYFNTSNAANSNAVVDARTNGTGSLYYGNHTGTTGNLLRLDAGGSPLLLVEKSGNVYASSTVTVTQTGADFAGNFVVSNAGNTNPSLRGETNGSGSGVYGFNTGTGKGAYFRINNAANAAAALDTQTNGTGVLITGNHTGASGNLLQLQSGGGDKFVVDHNGVVTTQGCPTGMADAGAYCIDTDDSNTTTDSWLTAALACQGAGKRLCYADEWYAACTSLALTGITDSDEITGNLAGNTADRMILMGNGGCDFINSVILNTAFFDYRCCLSK
jgi:hypothetical protein